MRFEEPSFPGYLIPLPNLLRLRGLCEFFLLFFFLLPLPVFFFFLHEGVFHSFYSSVVVVVSYEPTLWRRRYFTPSSFAPLYWPLSFGPRCFLTFPWICFCGNFFGFPPIYGSAAFRAVPVSKSIFLVFNLVVAERPFAAGFFFPMCPRESSGTSLRPVNSPAPVACVLLFCRPSGKAPVPPSHTLAEILCPSIPQRYCSFGACLRTRGSFHQAQSPTFFLLRYQGFVLGSVWPGVDLPLFSFHPAPLRRFPALFFAFAPVQPPF